MSDRLISADKLMETIKAHHYPLVVKGLNSTDYGMFTLGIQQVVDEQPTVDVVRHEHLGKDIIYRQDAIELAMQYCPDDDGTCSKANEDMRNLLDELEDLPSAVVEAETVRHGRWENYLAEGLRWKCSVCGSRFETPYHYCPNCGKEMKEVEE